MLLRDDASTVPVVSAAASMLPKLAAVSTLICSQAANLFNLCLLLLWNEDGLHFYLDSFSFACSFSSFRQIF
ncbi:hypothetical protein SHVI106290_10240 [Shewanella violacea]